MNLSKLFLIQEELDKRIEKEHRLEGQDLLDKKILALQVEIAELANELPEVFKFWSNKKNNYEKALKEYVDGLHFLLSIGNDLNYDYTPIAGLFPTSLVSLFLEVNYKASELYFFLYANNFKKTDKFVLDHYQELFDEYLMIGQKLGFKEEEIYNAYLAKNKINHARQESGY